MTIVKILNFAPRIATLILSNTSMKIQIIYHQAEKLQEKIKLFPNNKVKKEIEFM